MQAKYQASLYIVILGIKQLFLLLKFSSLKLCFWASSVTIAVPKRVHHSLLEVHVSYTVDWAPLFMVSRT